MKRGYRRPRSAWSAIGDVLETLEDSLSDLPKAIIEYRIVKGRVNWSLWRPYWGIALSSIPASFVLLDWPWNFVWLPILVFALFFYLSVHVPRAYGTGQSEEEIEIAMKPHLVGFFERGCGRSWISRCLSTGLPTVWLLGFLSLIVTGNFHLFTALYAILLVIPVIWWLRFHITVWRGWWYILTATKAYAVVPDDKGLLFGLKIAEAVINEIKSLTYTYSRGSYEKYDPGYRFPGGETFVGWRVPRIYHEELQKRRGK